MLFYLLKLIIMRNNNQAKSLIEDLLEDMSWARVEIILNQYGRFIPDQEEDCDYCCYSTVIRKTVLSLF
jgi:hypothetical protein